MNYFYAVGISISLAITSEIFIEIGYFFSVLWKKTKVDVFFWTHCRRSHNINSQSSFNVYVNVSDVNV